MTPLARSAFSPRRACTHLLAALACAIAPIHAAPEKPTLQSGGPVYETRAEHDPNGIGKFYLGREIAHVMGHQGAGWLERPDREAEERTDLLLKAMELKAGETVADIGAGSGYFCWRMAREVGPTGKIYGVDIQPEMLELLDRNMKRREVHNVVGVMGSITDPKLPAESVDTILMVDVYHEFDHPFEMLQSMTRSLRPGGRIVLVEYRAEDPSVPIKTVHKMSQEQVKREYAQVPDLRWEKTFDVLPRQHIFIFRKALKAR